MYYWKYCKLERVKWIRIPDPSVANQARTFTSSEFRCMFLVGNYYHLLKGNIGRNSASLLIIITLLHCNKIFCYPYSSRLRFWKGFRTSVERIQRISWWFFASPTVAEIRYHIINSEVKIWNVYSDIETGYTFPFHRDSVKDGLVTRS